MTRTPNPARTGNSAHFLHQLPSLALGLAGAFFGVAAWAERIEYTPDANPTDNVIGVIVIENNEGSGTGTHTVETEYGPVTVQYFTTLNQPYFGPDGQRTFCCPDDVRITDVPDGVLPSAWELQVDETGTATITLFLYVGG